MQYPICIQIGLILLTRHLDGKGLSCFEVIRDTRILSLGLPRHRVERHSEVAMKSQGEIEAAICVGINRFEQEYMGRGPKHLHTFLLGDFLVVRLEGVLTVAEQQLVKSQPPDKGRDLLKQVRTHLVETARPILEEMIEEVTGTKVLSLHHDISTFSGEEILVFTLAEVPTFRETKKK